MRIHLITLSMLFLGSCASKIIVDPKHIDQAQYKVDYTECKQLSEQVSSAKQAAKEGLFGAIVYGAIGAVIGSDSSKAAKIGAISGAASGASKGSMESGQVLRNCLTNRGYTVLN